MILTISTFVLCLGMAIYESYKQFHKFYKRRKQRHKGREWNNSDST